MKKVTLKKLTLTNYRNIEFAEYEFNGNSKIVGDNRIGKTNVLESICWLLTDKLLNGSSDIQQIKPLNDTKKVVMVAGVFDIDGKEISIEKHYAEDWVKEAEERGLKNYRTTPEAIEHYLDKKNIDLFTRMQIYTPTEMQSHYDIKLEKYCQVLNIEVNTMLKMVNKDIIPAAMKYMNVIADTEFKMQRIGDLCDAGLKLLKQLNTLINELSNSAEELDKIHKETANIKDLLKQAKTYAEQILPAMAKVRTVADQIEELLGEEYKPFPSYEDLLFSVQ